MGNLIKLIWWSIFGVTQWVSLLPLACKKLKFQPLDNIHWKHTADILLKTDQQTLMEMTDYFCNHKLLSFYSAVNAFMIFNKVERYSLNYSRLHLFNTKFICWWWIVSDCNGDLVKRQYVEDLWKLIGLSRKSKMKGNFNHFNKIFRSTLSSFVASFVEILMGIKIDILICLFLNKQKLWQLIILVYPFCCIF